MIISLDTEKKSLTNFISLYVKSPEKVSGRGIICQHNKSYKPIASYMLNG